MAIREESLQEIKTRVNIVDLVGEFVELKQMGDKALGCCPFHSEKTPSFNVNGSESYFKCFGCGKGGDVFTFIREIKSLSFVEAAEFLAGRAGVELKYDSPRQASRGGEQAKKKREEEGRLRFLASAAAAVYRGALHSKSGEKARAYLEKRQFSSEVLESFKVGYAPDAWNFIEEALDSYLKKSAPEFDRSKLQEDLLKLGLLKERSDKSGAKQEGSCYDSFRDRVLFPISRSDGATLAFGGRTLSSAKKVPKYINSPESSIYSKRQVFYAISQALDEIRRSKSAIIVEGYTDVLSLHQSGIHNCLATCGTSLTEEHAKLLSRFATVVTLLFDGDAAGQKAAASCFERFLNVAVQVDVVFLPPGEDPDTLCRKAGGRQGVDELFASQKAPVAEAYLKFHLSALGEESSGSSALAGRVAEKYCALVAQVKNPVAQELLLKRAAEFLTISLDSLNVLFAAEKEKLASRTQAFVASSRNSSERSFTRRPQASRPSFEGGSEAPSGDNWTGEVSAPAPELSDYFPAGVMDSGDDERSEPVPLSHKVTSPQKQTRNLDPYAEQLLVAVICAPFLAKTVLSTAGLFGESGLFAGSEPKLRQLLELISEQQELGELEQSVLLSEGEDRSSHYKTFEDMLSGLGFPASRLLQAALRQHMTCGSDIEALLSDAVRVRERRAIKKELEQLRSKEASSASAEELARIAQKKLLKRRENLS